jgi:photosystem II stability/assembly factor-like uncharacterized protein
MQRHSGIVSWKIIFLLLLVHIAFFSRGSVCAQSQAFKLKWAGANFDAFTLDGIEYWTVEDGGRIRHTTNVDAGTWTFQTVPTEVKDTLHRIFFLSDGLHGWAVGQNGWIINTVDGGAHWSILARIESILPYLDGPFEELYGIRFVDPNRGWVMGTYPFTGRPA